MATDITSTTPIVNARNKAKGVCEAISTQISQRPSQPVAKAMYEDMHTEHSCRNHPEGLTPPRDVTL